jgi:hypothetical protein
LISIFSFHVADFFCKSVGDGQDTINPKAYRDISAVSSNGSSSVVQSFWLHEETIVAKSIRQGTEKCLEHPSLILAISMECRGGRRQYALSFLHPKNGIDRYDAMMNQSSTSKRDFD